MSNLLDQIEAEQLKSNVPELRPGDLFGIHTRHEGQERRDCSLHLPPVVAVPGSPGSDATPGNDAASGVGAASANVKASWGGTHILSDPDTGTK